jgi:hypothetical protein
MGVKAAAADGSFGWLGRFSPKAKIRQSGLWREQQLQSAERSEDSTTAVTAVIRGLHAKTPGE